MSSDLNDPQGSPSAGGLKSWLANRCTLLARVAAQYRGDPGTDVGARIGGAFLSSHPMGRNLEPVSSPNHWDSIGARLPHGPTASPHLTSHRR
jgi:hypothetical protein